MTHIEALYDIQKLADDFMHSPTADTSETGMARLIGQRSHGSLTKQSIKRAVTNAA